MPRKPAAAAPLTPPAAVDEALDRTLAAQAQPVVIPEPLRESPQLPTDHGVAGPPVAPTPVVVSTDNLGDLGYIATDVISPVTPTVERVSDETTDTVLLQRRVEELEADNADLARQLDGARLMLAGYHEEQALANAPLPGDGRLVTPTNPHTPENAVYDAPPATIPATPGPYAPLR